MINERFTYVTKSDIIILIRYQWKYHIGGDYMRRVAACVVIAAGLVAVLLIKKAGSNKSVNIGQSGNETEEQSYWRTDSHGVCKAESGYYYLQYDDNKMLTMIRYMDGNTHKTTPVCAKAECMHDSSDCNAMLGNDYMSTQIHYYKGNIYVVRVDNGMAKLVKIAKDGSSREDVAELFANNGATSVSLVFHDDCVYAYDHIGHTGAVDSNKDDKEVIVKVELSTGKSSEVFSYLGAYNAIYGARSFGDKLFFQIFNCSIDAKTMNVDMTYQLYYYDYATGKSDKVSDENISDYYVDTQNNMLYYFVTGKGLYARKLNENTASLLYKADSDIIIASLSYDGSYIYMCNGGIASATNLREQTDEKIFVLKTDGTLINTIELDNSKMRNLYFGDDKYLFFEYDGRLVYIDKSNIAGDVSIVPVE